MSNIRVLAGAIVICATLTGCGPSSANLDDVKAHAAETFQQAGFKIIGYEGFNYGTAWLFMPSSYGGADVWYVLEKPASPSVTYQAYIQRWGDEYHIYELKAIDAIAPRHSP